MRRTKPDLSYKETTKNIIDRNIKPWQLIRKDEREGVHRLVNNIVSYIGELDSEKTYIENMFFPESMDLSEEWVVYTTYPAYSSDKLYLSGEHISNICTYATGTEELISNGFDTVKQSSTFTFGGSVESIYASAGKVEILSNRNIYTYDSVSMELLSTDSADVITSGEMSLVVGIDKRQFTIGEMIRPDSVKLTLNGANIPFTIKSASAFTAPWVDKYDCDGNGIIGNYEEYIARFNQGRSASEFTPDEWAELEWLDYDEDGTISDRDVERVLLHINSVAPWVEYVVTVSGNKTGAMILSYEEYNPKAVMFPKGTSRLPLITDDNIISSNYYRVTYESDSNVFFGITPDKSSVRAFRYDFDTDQILADSLIYIPDTTPDTVFIDIDNKDGFIYVLSELNGTCRISYDEIKKEYVESITRSSTVSTVGIPDSFTATTDGSFIVSLSGKLITLSAERDRYADIEGVAFFNQKRNYTLSDGSPIKTVPYYIFNSFDAFAYSLGIERPYGCDNIMMRKIIMDFWVHRQDNSEIGMNYGILRELGIIPETLSPTRNIYSLPERITYNSGELSLTVNSSEMTLIQSGDLCIFSGEPGTVNIYSGNLYTFSESILSVNDSLKISSYFSDANNDPVYLTYNLPVTKGKADPDIRIYSYADSELLESIGYIISGEPTSSLISYITGYETNDPFTYANSIVDVTPMDMKRINPDPVLPTIYDPVMSGIISSLQPMEIYI